MEQDFGLSRSRAILPTCHSGENILLVLIADANTLCVFIDSADFAKDTVVFL